MRKHDFLARDEWMRTVLADSQLSPSTRLVGVYLALCVDFDNWPTVGIRTDCASIAAWLGISVEQVVEAVATFMERRWLVLYGRGGKPHHYDLSMTTTSTNAEMRS
jgi:hypothetical protein